MTSTSIVGVWCGAMHELSLCLGIRDIVEKAREDRPVVAVQVQVGHLRQVVPETLTYCWTMVTEGSSLAGSVLEVEHVPARLDCRDCSQRTTIDEVCLLRCAECGSRNVTVVTGEELLVTSIDLDSAVPDKES